jgi:hypothetical protein
MVAIGYGDIVPQNKNEKLVAIGAMLLACVIYGYIMETVSIIYLFIVKPHCYSNGKIVNQRKG